VTRLRHSILILVAGSALALSPAADAHGLLQLEQLQQSNVAIPMWAIGGAYAASPELMRRLRDLTASGQGRPIKVAIVAQSTDLVDATAYYNLPDAYAAFLGDLMRSVVHYHGDLVVVMPNGVGYFPSRSLPSGTAMRSHMRDRWDVDSLLRTAIRAVVLVKSPKPENSSRSRFAIAGLGGLAILSAAVATLAVVRRRSHTPSSEVEHHSDVAT